MNWLQIDSNTFSMAVSGGTLYRFSDERGHAMHFVPWANVVTYPTSPPLSPYFTNGEPPSYNPAYCSSDNGAVAPR